MLLHMNVQAALQAEDALQRREQLETRLDAARRLSAALLSRSQLRVSCLAAVCQSSRLLWGATEAIEGCEAAWYLVAAWREEARGCECVYCRLLHRLRQSEADTLVRSTAALRASHGDEMEQLKAEHAIALRAAREEVRRGCTSGPSIAALSTHRHRRSSTHNLH